MKNLRKTLLILFIVAVIITSSILCVACNKNETIFEDGSTIYDVFSKIDSGAIKSMTLTMDMSYMFMEDDEPVEVVHTYRFEANGFSIEVKNKIGNKKEVVYGEYTKFEDGFIYMMWDELDDNGDLTGALTYKKYRANSMDPSLLGDESHTMNEYMISRLKILLDDDFSARTIVSSDKVEIYIMSEEGTAEGPYVMDHFNSTTIVIPERFKNYKVLAKEEKLPE